MAKGEETSVKYWLEAETISSLMVGEEVGDDGKVVHWSKLNNCKDCVFLSICCETTSANVENPWRTTNSSGHEEQGDIGGRVAGDDGPEK